ncbi:MAG: type IVB secretion system apparatus protein IcmL/DotI [Alphaproteobacteria bacterium]|nr:type IVB secretion system apparatus protein IcmL/DotI [Alphaproteobacteria bacterium]
MLKKKSTIGQSTKPIATPPQTKTGGAPQTDEQDTSGLGTVVIRNEFYRDGYRSLLKMALLQTLVIFGLIAVMFYVVHIHQPQHFYFATTEDGRLMPMVPLGQPNLSTPALMSWVAQATTEVMTFGFNDYRRRLQESSRNFTKRGWESFTQALNRSRIIEMMEAHQQVLSAAPKGAPILRSEGVVAGRWQWVVEIPLALTYQSGANSENTGLMITVVVVRVPRLESPNGVGIEQWIARSG